MSACFKEHPENDRFKDFDFYGGKKKNINFNYANGNLKSNFNSDISTDYVRNVYNNKNINDPNNFSNNCSIEKRFPSYNSNMNYDKEKDYKEIIPISYNNNNSSANSYVYIVNKSNCNSNNSLEENQINNEIKTVYNYSRSNENQNNNYEYRQKYINNNISSEKYEYNYNHQRITSNNYNN